jgi:uncharacterized membrane protein YcaP (DUF421 family)
MDLVLRTTAVYFVLWALFRFAGKRTLADITTFDFILLLVISECTQQALVGQDFSVTGGMLAVATFLLIDVVLSLLKHRHRQVGKVLDSVPVVLYADGRLLRDRMDKERVDAEEILVAARRQHGLESFDQIKYAVLEQSGTISIIPKTAGAARAEPGATA